MSPGGGGMTDAAYNVCISCISKHCAGLTSARSLFLGMIFAMSLGSTTCLQVAAM